MLEFQTVPTNQTRSYYSVTASNQAATVRSSLVAVGVLKPPLALPRTNAWVAKLMCLSQLKSISLAGGLLATDNQERFPLSLGAMTNDLGFPIFGWPTLLYCPVDPLRTTPSNWSLVDFNETSYEIVLTNDSGSRIVGETNGEPISEFLPFARCKVHGFVVRTDGTFDTNMALPVIYGQPQEVRVASGQPATFSVDASGTPPLQFQWRRNGAAIPSGTNQSFFIPSAQASDEGAYDVIVTNSFGTTTSSKAVLRLREPVRVTVSGISPQGTNLQLDFRLTQLPEQGSVVIESSFDLRTWQALQTNIMPMASIEFSEVISTNHQRFFRAVERSP